MILKCDKNFGLFEMCIYFSMLIILPLGCDNNGSKSNSSDKRMSFPKQDTEYECELKQFNVYMKKLDYSIGKTNAIKVSNESISILDGPKITNKYLTSAGWHQQGLLKKPRNKYLLLWDNVIIDEQEYQKTQELFIQNNSLLCATYYSPIYSDRHIQEPINGGKDFNYITLSIQDSLTSGARQLIAEWQSKGTMSSEGLEEFVASNIINLTRSEALLLERGKGKEKEKVVLYRANLKMAHGSTNRQAFDRKLSQ